MMSRYDDELVCPYCGSVQDMASKWAVSRNRVCHECDRCGRPFIYDVEVIHSYYTMMLEEDD